MNQMLTAVTVLDHFLDHFELCCSAVAGSSIQAVSLIRGLSTMLQVASGIWDTLAFETANEALGLLGNRQTQNSPGDGHFLCRDH